MTMSGILVYGAGGHGKVVADILLSGGHDVAGFLDDNTFQSDRRILGCPVINAAEALARGSGLSIALGIGNADDRYRVFNKCLASGATVVTAIHPTAAVSASARIGRGTVVMAGAVINPEASIGEGAIVNSGAVVEHDVVLGDFSHIAPNASTGGAARLGKFSQLGIGAAILPGVKVGERCSIGAGAVVLKDLPDGVVAVGVPASIIRTMALGGRS